MKMENSNKWWGVKWTDSKDKVNQGKMRSIRKIS